MTTTTEEREIPELGQLLSELPEMQGRLDTDLKNAEGNGAAVSAVVAKFMQNDLVPWLKDLLESVMVEVEDLNDAVAPVELPRAAAQDLVEILQATRQGNLANEVLVARIDGVLPLLMDEEDDEEGEDEDDEG